MLKFSFIVPAYVRDETDYGAVNALGRCLDSVTAQTDDSWEAIVVSDGPSPIIRAVVEDYAKRYPAKFRHAETPYVGKRGGHYAVECAKDSCAGEFITVLNGDNTLRPEYVARLYSPDADILFCSVRMNDLPGYTINCFGMHRGGVDRLNYSIRAGIAKMVKHKMHLDADYDWMIDCWHYRDDFAPVRCHRVEETLAEHN